MSDSGPDGPFQLRDARTDAKGFAELANLYGHARNQKGALGVVDCSGVQWIDGNLACALAAINHLLYSESRRRLHLSRMKPSLKALLTEAGLFGKASIPNRPSIVPIKHFTMTDSRAFAGYTQDHLTKSRLPAMSDAVAKRVFEGIDEIFNNFVIHSQSREGLYAGGQFFPRRSRLEFSLADMGIGIPRVVEQALESNFSAPEAIEWAMSDRNTTRSGDVPGGLGLKILREFIEKNGGAMSVVSGAGFWSSSPKGVERVEMVNPFPGTVVTIEVDTSDPKRYQLDYEIDPSAVF